MAEPAAAATIGPPIAENDKGERLEFRDGQWQKPQSWLDWVGKSLGEWSGTRETVGREVTKGVPFLGAVPGLETEKTKALEAESPGTATALRVAGGATALGPLGATAAGGRALGTVGNMLPKMVMGATSGATIGAGDAALRGEDPKSAALMSGLFGAAAPGVAGVGGLIGEGVGHLAGSVVRKGRELLGQAGPLAGVDPLAIKWARDLARMDGLSDAQIAAREEAVGPYGMLLDYGHNLRGQASGIARSMGAGKTTITEALRKRAEAARPTIDQHLTDAMGRPINIPEYTEFLKEQRSTNSDPWYEQFRNMRVHPTKQLQDLMPALEEAGALKEGHHLAKVEQRPELEQYFIGGPQKSFPTAETWDYAKRGLDKIIQDARPGAPNANPNRYRVYSTLKSKLMDALENHPDPIIGQVYKEARQNYAEPSSMMDALKEGGEWRGVHKHELPIILKNKNSLDRVAFLQGVRGDLDDMLMDSARGGNRVAAFFEAPSNQEKLATILKNHPNPDIAANGAERAEELVRNMKRQREFGETKNAVTGNSVTAGALAAQAMMSGTKGLSERMLEKLPEYALHVTPVKYVPGVGTLKKTAAEESARQLERAQASAANLLTRPSSDAAATLRALQGYTVPGEASGPALRDLVNALVRGGAVEPQARESARRRAAPLGNMIAPIFR